MAPVSHPTGMESSIPIFSFINDNPSSAAEKERNRKLVRSNAMKRFRLQAKERLSRERGLNGAEPETLKPLVLQRKYNITPLVETRTSGRPPFVPTKAEPHARNHIKASLHGVLLSESENVGYQANNDLSRKPRFMIVPRQGSQDPFRYYPVQSWGTYVDELIDYGKSPMIFLM